MTTFKQFLQESEYGPEDELVDKQGTAYTVQRETHTDAQGKKRLRYEVRLKGKDPGNWVIAHVNMSSAKPNQAMSVGVKDTYQRKGIATELYKYIEKDLGITLEPNWALTSDGEKFWQSRKR